VIIFGTFFLFEILKNLQVHPIQYALVGAAQGVFYLLLLSFSEQFSFGLAYLGSSAACVLLISWYVSYVLQGIRRALSLTVIMSGIYGTLYILLRSQQHTLMLGSVLIFLLIAVVMILTRHINWYQVGSRKVQP
jgi:inner membrane protein